MQQLLAAIEAARSAPAPIVVQDPLQTTIPLLFASQQRVSEPVVPAPAATLQQAAILAKTFDISDSQKTADVPIESAVTQTEAMQVVGDCPGEKRKIEHISISRDDESECTGDEKAGSPRGTALVTAERVTAQRTLASDRELTRTAPYAPPRTFENRDKMLAVLRGKAKANSDMLGKQHLHSPF